MNGLDTAQQIQPVHDRHADIGNYQINASCGQLFQRFSAVVCKIRQFKPGSFPYPVTRYQKANRFIIIYKQYPIHGIHLPSPTAPATLPPF